MTDPEPAGAEAGPAAPSPAPRRPRRLRLVVPRFGPGVNGGSELLVRRLAVTLQSRRWEIEVWTTTAGDEATWTPAFPPGDDLDGAIRVRRFPVMGRRAPRAFHQMSRGLFRLPPQLRPETAWLVAQGPFAPALVRALATAADRPTLFTPYLYHPTIWGLPAAPHPRLLIPAAHDEPALRLRAVGRALAASDALWYGTDEERTLLEAVHPVAARRPHAVGTVAIDPPTSLEPAGFRRRHQLGRYLLYAGRATPGKGVEMLLDGFGLLRRERPDVSLVLIGDPNGPAEVPEGVVSLGWVDDAEHWDAVAGAEAVVVTSRLESLSLITLEAWAAGRPCLLNGDSPVLAGQAERSGGALLFHDPGELADRAGALLADPAEAARRGDAGRRHVALHYRWNAVVRRLEALIAAGESGAARRTPPP
ncbi:MAG: glycosyltransferase family 4 protein [Candidatus Dormibacteria bacterium]